MRINLIALYNLYLIVIFGVGIALRLRLYLQIMNFVLSLSHRWPKLGQLILEHRWILVAWQTLAPTVLTLIFTILHSLVVYYLLPEATLTPHDLRHHPVWTILLTILALTMLILDGFSLYYGSTDVITSDLEKQLDQAEFWLSSRWSTIIEWLTLRKIRPRQLVREQLRTALQAVAVTINHAMWFWAIQLAVRLLLALAMWLTWFLAVP
ncbi:MAG: hypothetical protein RMI91_08205 [Gemmatales bacterium]|nr:hypothetical protein [Gemmatales bacterium]MDW7994624.1 hypothetical protein [Gemmatales bacterium]